MCANASPVLADAVPVVSTRSAVTTLTPNQLADIFLGKTGRFPNGDPVTPIDQVEGNATRQEFYARYTGKSSSQLKAHWSKIIFTGRGQPPEAVPTAADMKKKLADDPSAIGYIDERQVDGSVRVVNVR